MSFEITSGWYDVEPPVVRKLARVFIPPEFIIGIFNGEYVVDSAMFPKDVKIVSVNWDSRKAVFDMVLTSEDYYETCQGCEIYILSVRLKKTNSD